MISNALKNIIDALQTIFDALKANFETLKTIFDALKTIFEAGKFFAPFLVVPVWSGYILLSVDAGLDDLTDFGRHFWS